MIPFNPALPSLHPHLLCMFQALGDVISAPLRSQARLRDTPVSRPHDQKQHRRKSQGRSPINGIVPRHFEAHDVYREV